MTSAGSEPLAAQPRALIVTIYGLYARPGGGWLSIAALIRLMAELGVDEPAVRSAISRLKQRGLLEPGRVDGAAGYGLSGRGQKILADGDRRIFRPARPAGAGDWLLAVFSVPEHERAKRHALRSRLAWLGFGTVAAGVWIAPAQLAQEARDVLEADGLAGYVSLFAAGYLAFGSVTEKIGQWWDLDRLGQLYRAFTDSAGPVLDRWLATGPDPDKAEDQDEDKDRDQDEDKDRDQDEDKDRGQAFADYVRVVTAWRRLPFLDPGLPAEALPADWHGARAAEIFLQLHGCLGGPAGEFFLTVTH